MWRRISSNARLSRKAGHRHWEFTNIFVCTLPYRPVLQLRVSLHRTVERDLRTSASLHSRVHQHSSLLSRCRPGATLRVGSSQRCCNAAIHIRTSDCRADCRHCEHPSGSSASWSALRRFCSSCSLPRLRSRSPAGAAACVYSPSKRATRPTLEAANRTEPAQLFREPGQFSRSQRRHSCEL